MSSTSKPKTIFSGIQPTGQIHIGNYLGALKQWVELQHHYDQTLYCIVDLHAITVHHSPAALKHAVKETLACFIAIGIDPAHSSLFVQSSVPEHTELCWILSCITRYGWLNRMTQFKEKSGSNREQASIGLYTYPILMAADILAYHATHIPVGDDQRQHLELTNEIIKKFNHDYSQRFRELNLPTPYFSEIQGIFPKHSARIMSLKNASAKMSKSDPSEQSRLSFYDPPEIIKKKIHKAKTDSEPFPDSEALLEDKLEARNLLNIYCGMTSQTKQEALTLFGGKPYTVLKHELTDACIAVMQPIQKRLHELLQDPTYLQQIAEQGAAKARTVARKTLSEVKKIIGVG